ncbi:MAG: DUF4230 domain-containing protein [Bacteroidota bacterium]
MSARIRLSGLIVVVVLLIGALIAAYVVVVKIPLDLATATAREIKEAFQVTPQVRINQTVVIEQNTPIMELATVARQLMVDYSWTHTWLGSTKTLHLRGVFTAKAGINLREPFHIVITRNPLRVEALLPPPRILSLTMDSYGVLEDDSGWWNKISNADRESAMQSLQATARTQAESSGMLDEVRASFQDRIKQIVEKNGAVVEFSSPLGHDHP